MHLVKKDEKSPEQSRPIIVSMHVALKSTCGFSSDSEADMKKLWLLLFIFFLIPGINFCSDRAENLSYPVGCMQIIDVNQKLSQENLRSCVQDIVNGINETRGQIRAQTVEKNAALAEQNKAKDAKIEQLENRIHGLENAMAEIKKEIQSSKPKANPHSK
jgi:hypothetical protein